MYNIPPYRDCAGGCICGSLASPRVACICGQSDDCCGLGTQSSIHFPIRAASTSAENELMTCPSARPMGILMPTRCALRRRAARTIRARRKTQKHGQSSLPRRIRYASSRIFRKHLGRYVMPALRNETSVSPDFSRKPGNPSVEWRRIVFQHALTPHCLDALGSAPYSCADLDEV